MALIELPPVSVFCRGTPSPRGDSRGTVAWIRGDHDHATSTQLSARLAEAADRDDVDLIVDLSGVTFMDASTINTIVNAFNDLRAHSRSLAVRSPTPLARRLLDVCGLAFLIDENPASTPLVRRQADSHPRNQRNKGATHE